MCLAYSLCMQTVPTYLRTSHMGIRCSLWLGRELSNKYHKNMNHMRFCYLTLQMYQLDTLYTWLHLLPL